MRDRARLPRRQWIGATLGAIGMTGAIGAIAPAADAHGADVRLENVRAYRLEATYDSGEPMAGAQVRAFHSDDPKTAAHTGTTDDEGRWLWVADRTGSWTFQVRQAGHGSATNIEVAPLDGSTADLANDASADSASSATAPGAAAATNRAAVAAKPLPRWVALASVIWGAIGTALFFSRPAAPDRTQPPASQDRPAS